MSKPSYLGLLNAISVAETEAHGYLNAWADTTDDPQLAETLRFVAMREGEHGIAFAKRMLELGYEVRRPGSTTGAEAAMSVATATDCSDAEKFEALKVGRAPSGTDVFDSMFSDKTIDPVTGGLLGRYIAEERDSGHRLAAEYERVRAAANAKNGSKKGKGRGKPKAKGKAKAKS
ncbi:MAG: hypothetical protein ACFCVK_22215 [Acidimicrobiales bacterium]